jgi:hypothetical protein
VRPCRGSRQFGSKGIRRPAIHPGSFTPQLTSGGLPREVEYWTGGERDRRHRHPRDVPALPAAMAA